MVHSNKRMPSHPVRVVVEGGGGQHIKNSHEGHKKSPEIYNVNSTWPNELAPLIGEVVAPPHASPACLEIGVDCLKHLCNVAVCYCG